MHLTQGTFSYLPDLTDDEIRAQVQYALDRGWPLSVEFTDDPHPRNTYWEMWGLPMFDLHDAAGVLFEVNECRKAYPGHYIRVDAYDAAKGRQTIALSFLVNRPAAEPGFRLDRQEASDRQIRYTTHSYATGRPAGSATRTHGRKRLRTGGADGVRRPPGGQRPRRRKRHRTPRPASPSRTATSSTWRAERRRSGVDEVLGALDEELVGLAPVKARIRQIAALLLVDSARARFGLTTARPNLHMCFTGDPGTGKTTVALRMADLLKRLGYLERGHLVAVGREDLVGQYVGHTAPKTKEVLKRAMGGVLFIDEAYYLYRDENERDYGQESIEILLQVMENQREDLVVILAGYKDRMDTFFQSNPGISSRIAHHIDFPGYTIDELGQIGILMVGQAGLRAVAGRLRHLPRLPDPAAAATQVRQRPQRSQRPRTGPAAPRQPAVRQLHHAGVQGRPHPARTRGLPGQQGLPAGRRGRGRPCLTLARHSPGTRLRLSTAIPTRPGTSPGC